MPVRFLMPDDDDDDNLPKGNTSTNTITPAPATGMPAGATPPAPPLKASVKTLKTTGKKTPPAPPPDIPAPPASSLMTAAGGPFNPVTAGMQEPSSIPDARMPRAALEAATQSPQQVSDTNIASATKPSIYDAENPYAVDERQYLQKHGLNQPPTGILNKLKQAFQNGVLNQQAHGGAQNMTMGQGIGTLLGGVLGGQLNPGGYNHLRYDLYRRPEFERELQMRNMMQGQRWQQEDRAWTQEERDRARELAPISLQQAQLGLKNAQLESENLPTSIQLGNLGRVATIENAGNNQQRLWQQLMMNEALNRFKGNMYEANTRRANEQTNIGIPAQAAKNNAAAEKIERTPQSKELSQEQAVKLESKINNNRLGLNTAQAAINTAKTPQAKQRATDQYNTLKTLIENDVNSLTSNASSRYSKVADENGVANFQHK